MTAKCEQCGGQGWYAEHADDCSGWDGGNCDCGGVQIQCRCSAPVDPHNAVPDLVAELEKAGSSISVYKDIAALLLRAAAELKAAREQAGTENADQQSVESVVTESDDDREPAPCVCGHDEQDHDDGWVRCAKCDCRLFRPSPLDSGLAGNKAGSGADEQRDATPVSVSATVPPTGEACVCRSHGKAVLVTHVDDATACSDFLSPLPPTESVEGVVVDRQEGHFSWSATVSIPQPWPIGTPVIVQRRATE